MEPPTIGDFRVNAAVDPDSPIGQTARAWALAVMGEDFPPERSRRLGAWLDADPLHRRAYEEAESVILMLGDLSAPPAALPVRRAPKRWRVPVLAACGGLLAASLAVAVVALPAPAYETRPGETRQIALSDGSRVTLAPASRLRAASRWRPRSLKLERGEAFFVVARQAGRPFTVEAGDALVRVIGTRFNVHRGLDDVRVEVEQGVVQVSDRFGGQERAVTLQAGQLATTGGPALSVGALSKPDLAGGWREGRLAYDDAPLAEVVADLNRYGRPALGLGSASVGRLKVTAAFEVAQADRFVAELPRVLPVRLVADGRGGKILVAADAKGASEPHAP